LGIVVVFLAALFSYLEFQCGWLGDTTPTSHNETPTRIETRTHNQSGDAIEKWQAPDDGCINVRNMSSIEEVK